MTLKKQEGFTLIELLVVVAVIGVLAAVIFASLGNARLKGMDGSIRKQMLEARSQAEIFYHNNSSSYANVCTATGGIGTLAQAASTSAGTTLVTNGALQTATTGNCFSTAAGYAVSIKLRVPTTTTYFCVDATNKGMQTTTPLAASSVTCL